MKREEAKELLPVIQAFAEGKNVEYYNKTDDKWYEMDSPSFSSVFEWRIKPEPKYRPFKDADECWNEMLKHEPFGWIKTDNNKRCYVACVFEPDKEGDSMTIETIGYKSFKGALACYTFADGTPFGIKEGGEE